MTKLEARATFFPSDPDGPPVVHIDCTRVGGCYLKPEQAREFAEAILKFADYCEGGPHPFVVPLSG